MSIALILFWALFLCVAVALIILTFPSSFARDSMKIGVKRIQKRFIIIGAVLCVLVGLTNNPPNSFISIVYIIPALDMKIALMIIPVVACLLFSIGLYYPTTRFLVKENQDDVILIENLLMKLFRCAFGDNDGRESSLLDLSSFCEENKQFIEQYGLKIYINEYQSHTNSINHKPQAELTNYVLDKCSRVKYDIDHFEPTPFPNIGLIVSFVFSTILTVLLSLITM